MTRPVDAESISADSLSLTVGGVLNLELLSTPQNSRHDVRLIGYAKGKSLLVTAPLVNGTPVTVYNGYECNVRYLQGTKVFGFHSCVLAVCNHPYRYLHLSYPEVLNAVTFRRSERIRKHIPVTVHPEGDPEGASPKSVAAMLDISTTGARLVSQKDIGEEGELIRMAFNLVFSGLEHRIQLLAVIRNRGDRTTTGGRQGGHYGVEFKDVSEQDKLFIHGFIYEHLITLR